MMVIEASAHPAPPFCEACQRVVDSSRIIGHGGTFRVKGGQAASSTMWSGVIEVDVLFATYPRVAINNGGLRLTRETHRVP